MTSSISVEFCGEWFPRDADLSVDDDNPFLHRRFLSVVQVDTLWWLVNIGSRLSATITDPSGAMQAWLAPGARIPLVFDETKVVFTAGPTTYDLSIHTETPSFERIAGPDDPVGETTVGAVQLTASQKLLILALSEQMLAREGSGMSTVPTSAQAAEQVQPQARQRGRQARPDGRARAARRPGQAREQPPGPARGARGHVPAGHGRGPAAARPDPGPRRGLTDLPAAG